MARNGPREEHGRGTERDGDGGEDSASSQREDWGTPDDESKAVAEEDSGLQQQVLVGTWYYYEYSLLGLNKRAVTN